MQMNDIDFNPLTTVHEISRAGVYGECVLKQHSARVQRVKE